MYTLFRTNNLNNDYVPGGGDKKVIMYFYIISNHITFKWYIFSYQVVCLPGLIFLLEKPKDFIRSTSKWDFLYEIETYKTESQNFVYPKFSKTVILVKSRV